MYGRLFSIVIFAVLALGIAFVYELPPTTALPLEPVSLPNEKPDHRLFKTADACMGCHNNLVTPEGEDISIGAQWRASMMANAARDPYWQAAVRREVIDHPEAKDQIEDKCATCHMPMARFEASVAGQTGSVFDHLPISQAATGADLLAADGVSCTTCHQITPEKLGMQESFDGGFVIDRQVPMGERAIYGPYAVDEGRSRVMHSATGFHQEASDHMQQSALCATCHTLYTTSLGPGGEVVGELPEQVPYLEWQHSAYREERSCQSCHMPVVTDSTAITAVLGQPRAGVSRHVFRGGNFFMLRMLNRYRAELGVKALPQELEATIQGTINHLKSLTATVSIHDANIAENQLQAMVTVENLAGHKLPTAYPSRRVWLHFLVQDRFGETVFESGKLEPLGAIAGNNNDIDATRYEPHYNEITQQGQVQIYESIMVDYRDNLTTGLLSGVKYVKDNRILPRGFDKTTAREDIAVRGNATRDPNFMGSSDLVRYVIDVADRTGPFHIQAELWYQPIGYRWAVNLKSYDAAETNRFVGYYESMSHVSGIVLAAGDMIVE